ncbi:hypothetical protein DSL92_05195 [Billgrantia gudaonensis]|uniref:Uncharacterized protein n=1 Tax=Billgrantia gudaonensis TaxID=376427 RepID=A0A3S0NX17_9GAMM|nr:hypothetical protein DSL92_05195 [Halomonas gudaonensis]
MEARMLAIFPTGRACPSVQRARRLSLVSGRSSAQPGSLSMPGQAVKYRPRSPPSTGPSPRLCWLSKSLRGYMGNIEAFHRWTAKTTSMRIIDLGVQTLPNLELPVDARIRLATATASALQARLLHGISMEFC